MFCPSCDKEISSEEANYCRHNGKGRFSLPSRSLFVIVYLCPFSRVTLDSNHVET